MAKREKKRLRKIKKIRSKRQLPSALSIGVRLLPYIIFAGVLFLLFKGAQNLLLHSEYFTIREVEVAGHGQVKTRSSIAKELYSKKNTNIFMQDIKECEYAIEQLHPELKNVVVHRKLPDTLSVLYELRKPICQISSGYYYLVSDDAVIISQPQSSKERGLVVVSGIKVPSKNLYAKESGFYEPLKRAIAIIKDVDENYQLLGEDKIVEVNIYDIDNPALFLEDGTRIELGRHRFKDKSEAIKNIINELKSRNRKAKVIDLRFEDVVVVPR